MISWQSDILNVKFASRLEATRIEIFVVLQLASGKPMKIIILTRYKHSSLFVRIINDKKVLK
jgi:hypothetical protein